MEYALLYTFSTIPQTLAAALGVLAAFVLYRLQSDSNTLWQDAQDLVLQFGAYQRAAAAPEVTLGDLMGEQKYDLLLAELQRLYAEHESPPLGSIRYLKYARFRASLTARGKILAALKVAFWATAAVISPYTPAPLSVALMISGSSALHLPAGKAKLSGCMATGADYFPSGEAAVFSLQRALTAAASSEDFAGGKRFTQPLNRLYQSDCCCSSRAGCGPGAQRVLTAR